jgi:hypothetical protein
MLAHRRSAQTATLLVRLRSRRRSFHGFVRFRLAGHTLAEVPVEPSGRAAVTVAVTGSLLRINAAYSGDATHRLVQRKA